MEKIEINGRAYEKVTVMVNGKELEVQGVTLPEWTHKRRRQFKKEHPNAFYKVKKFRVPRKRKKYDNKLFLEFYPETAGMTFKQRTLYVFRDERFD